VIAGSPPAARQSDRVALIINPHATVSTAGVRTQVAHALAAVGVEWTEVTRGPGDAGRMARECSRAGATVVVTLGGDGTVADVAGVLAGGPTALAPLPGGNANVFSRALGWPGTVDEALSSLVAALHTPRRTVRLGRLRADGLDHVFVVNCGIGLDAATVEWIEDRPRLKRRLRQAGFALGAVAATTGGRSAPHLRVAADDAEPVEVVTLLAACGSPYTYLRSRPLDLVPGADFDGSMRWTGLRDIRPDHIMRLMAEVARGRPLPAHPSLVTGGVETALTVTADAPAPVQADGEVLGRHTTVLIEPGPTLDVVDVRPS